MTEPLHPLENFRGDARPPSEQELSDARFAPGTPAEHRFGVLYQGEYETPWDGTAAAVRLHARALASTGIPVRLTSFSYVVINEFGVAEPVHAVGLPPEVEAEVGALRRTSCSAHVPVIRHAVIRSAEHAHAVLVPRGAIAASEDVADVIAMRKAIAGSTILYTVWERDRIEANMARELGRAGQLWVPCQQNREILIRSGIDPERVHVVPHPYDPEDDICKVASLKEATGARRDWRLFYTIGRWEPRKGYAELIRAFLQAFKPTDKVMLTIKYSGGQWPGYPTPEEAIKLALAASPAWSAEKVAERVILLSGRGPRTGIIELHYRNNIYVCSSHGEAWCLPAFEALVSGNALVAVPYGGVVDFMPPDKQVTLSVVLPSGMELVPESYRWPPGTEWCGFTVDALADALRRATVPARFEIPEHIQRFEMARVGAQMYDLVMKLAETCKPEAYEYFRGQSKAWRNQ
jgi:glycosyltransferase involved in cell wall biosynthesis